MLSQEITDLYNQLRLNSYRQLFGAIRERDGSLSATEAYAVDVIFLLGSPTVTQLAEALGISQPNATYKVNNLVAKGYVVKTSSEEDRRECRLQLSEKFYRYYQESTRFVDDTVAALEKNHTPEELAVFENVLRTLKKEVR